MLSERESGEIKKGLLDMVVLCLLKGEDKYSYQLRQEIVGKSQGNFTVTSAALYTVLYRLEREGFLKRPHVLSSGAGGRGVFAKRPGHVQRHPQGHPAHRRRLGRVRGQENDRRKRIGALLPRC